MARCTDCDLVLTDVDRAAMAAVNAEYSAYTAVRPYDLDHEDAEGDMHCAACLDHRAERAQERRDSDFYGGDSPTLSETLAAARRLK
jgi:hypothetical protein